MSLQDQLRELFNLDKQVRGMRARLDAALTRTGAQQQKRQQLEQQRGELDKQLKQVQTRVSALEGQVRDMEERIDKARAQMNAVRSNKEYSALLVEVNTLKVDKGKVEEQALEQMQQVDTIKAKVAEIDEKIAERQKLEAQSRGEVEAARQEAGARLDELTAQRDAAAQALPPDVARLFNRLADNYEGEAMAEVEEQSRRHREYICAGCYMELPYERVNVVMSRPDEVVTCPNCGRILYINQDLKTAIGSKEYPPGSPGPDLLTSPAPPPSAPPAPMKLILHTDGGSRGNPGPAAAGVVLTDAATSQPVHEAGYFLGKTTNNVAEYQGLLRGLDAAHELGATELLVRSDSELMVRQLNGQYKVKSPDLKPLFEQAQAKLRRFGRASIEHVYRHKNADADRLANLAMDARRDTLVIDRGRRVAAPGSAPPAPGNAPPAPATIPCFTAALAGKPRQCLAGQAPGNDYTFGPTTPEGFCVHAAAAALSGGPLQWPASQRSGQARCSACGCPVKLTRLA